MAKFAHHMGDPHGDPQTQPTTRRSTWISCMVYSLKRNQVHVGRRVVGWSAGRHVDHPCGGGQISPWPARKVTEKGKNSRKLIEKSTPFSKPARKSAIFGSVCLGGHLGNFGTPKNSLAPPTPSLSRNHPVQRPHLTPSDSSPLSCPHTRKIRNVAPSCPPRTPCQQACDDKMMSRWQCYFPSRSDQWLEHHRCQVTAAKLPPPPPVAPGKMLTNKNRLQFFW